MIPLPSKSRISNLDVQSNASYRRKKKGGAMMVNFPVSSGSRLSGLALKEKLYKMLFVGGKHNFFLMVIVYKYMVRQALNQIPGE